MIRVPTTRTEDLPALCAGIAAEAVALAREPGPPRLWLVTRDADTDPAHAAVRGLAGAIRSELPGLRCTSVDLPSDAGEDALLAELAADGPELRVSLGEVRRVARLSS